MFSDVKNFNESPTCHVLLSSSFGSHISTLPPTAEVEARRAPFKMILPRHPRQIHEDLPVSPSLLRRISEGRAHTEDHRG